MRDLRQAVSVLLHRPWYTASILTVLAVGFGLLASTLAVVDGVLFKPLGYPGEKQLVAVRVSSSRSRTTPRVRPDDLAAWASRAPGVAFTGFRVHTTEDSGAGRAIVSSNFFDVIGVRPAIGGFAPEHFQGPVPPIEPRIVTHEIFQSRFGGDSGAIGRTVITNPSLGSGYRLVGVMPRGFVFPYDRVPVGYLTPVLPVQFYDRLPHVIARVPPGVTANDVRLRVVAAAARNGADAVPVNPDDPAIDQADVQPLARALGATSRPLFSALLAAAGLLLVVAALNASSLMAARSLDRGRDFAVRRALGATPRDIGRLLLAEAALLVGGGAAIGLLLAIPCLRLIVPLLPDDVVIFRAAAIDARVAAVLALAAAVLAGLATMGLLRRTIAGGARLEPGRAVTEPARSTSRRLVVAVQVALAFVLTVAGSLLVGSLLSIYAQKEPIATDGVMIVPARFLDRAAAGDRANRMVRVNTLLERLRHVPGVDAAAVTAADFLNGGYSQPWFDPPPTVRKARLAVQGQQVTANYYRVLEPQLVAGRLPTAEEGANQDPVIVVGERVASHYWPDAPAVGQTLTDSGRNGVPSRVFTVVGVVKDVRWFAWDAAEVPTIYSPYVLTARLASPTFLIRTSGDTVRVTVDVLRAMGEVDPLLRPDRPAPLDELFVDSVRARRTREIGIRMTCGASRGRIVTLMLDEQLVPVIAGLIAGGIGAAWAVGFVKGYLYQVTTSDARVWVAAIGLILLTAAAGTLVPALRASRIDPTQALRAE